MREMMKKMLSGLIKFPDNNLQGDMRILVEAVFQVWMSMLAKDIHLLFNTMALFFLKWNLLNETLRL